MASAEQLLTDTTGKGEFERLPTTANLMCSIHTVFGYDTNYFEGD